MICPACQFENPPEMKFCGGCGAKLRVVCPSCGAEPPPGFKFCGECGAPVAPGAPGAPATPPPELRAKPQAAPPASTAAGAGHSYTPDYLARKILRSKNSIEGERKQVTVLFCDLANSTALAARVGAEIMHGVLNRFFELALGEVHRYEGTINQFLGDGFMALFGAPIAHENHPRRAVLAALNLQRTLAEHLAELGGDQGAEFTVRIGINTGIVVVGGIGDNLRMDYTAVGDTTNLAARLQGLAEPGTILISDAVQQLVRGQFDVETLEPQLVKGKTEPIQAYKVLGTGSRLSSQAKLADETLSPFIGRAREQAILEDLMTQVEEGNGQVVGVAGEAGTGKSRLLHEFRARMRGKKLAFLPGRCLSYGTAIPYLPLIHLLRTAWEIRDGDGAQEITQKALVNLKAVGLDPDGCLPQILHLLEVKEGTEGLAGLSPKALRDRTFEALRQIVLNASRLRPVVIEIEDLHWIDETSEDFLAHLAESLAGARVLLVVSYRSGYRPRWVDKSYATQLSLRPLARDESLQLLGGALERSPVSERVLELIVDKAQGNPFFLEELARTLVEGGEPDTDATVPGTIQGVLTARIDRLPEAQKRLLQTASVVGREFPLLLLQAIWDEEGDLDALLRDLKRSELLFEGSGTDEEVFFFKLTLMQEVIYASLLTARRQHLHAAAGRSLERLYANNPEIAYGSLAYHFSRGDEPEKAVRYLRLSSAKAAGSYAHAEAAAALEEALGHVDRLPAERQDRERIELTLELAQSLFPLARFPQTLELLLRHQEEVERLADPKIAGPFYFWLSHTYSFLGEQAKAAEAAERSITAAAACADDATQGRALYVLARDGFWAGQPRQGIEAARRSVELLERVRDRWWQAQAYWVAAFNLYVLGEVAPALETIARAHAIGVELGDHRLYTSWSVGYFQAGVGEPDLGIAACERGLAESKELLNTAAARGFLGYAYLEKGDAGQAIEHLSQAVELLAPTGLDQVLGWFCAYLGEALLAGGRMHDAEAQAARALEVSSRKRFGYGVGLGQRALGKVALAGGRLAEAESRLREAQATFVTLGARIEQGRTWLDLAELAGAQGDEGTAAARIADAVAMFTELGVPRLTERARSLGSELNLAPPAPAARSATSA